MSVAQEQQWVDFQQCRSDSHIQPVQQPVVPSQKLICNPHIEILPHSNEVSGARNLTIDTVLAGSFSVQSVPLSSPTLSQLAPPSRRTRRNDFFDYGPSFGETIQEFNVLSIDKNFSHELKMSARMDRGFFIVNQDWTCYRRNYIQISACFSSSSAAQGFDVETPCLVEISPGVFKVITEFMIGISSQTDETERKIELIQHTTKRDKGPQSTPVPMPCAPGGMLSTNLTMSYSSNVVTFDRLRFKSSTANNGKRRATQQYFRITMELWVKFEDGSSQRIASTTSCPLIVRGRSPGHYLDNVDRLPSPRVPSTPYDSPYTPSLPSPQYGNYLSPYPQFSPVNSSFTNLNLLSPSVQTNSYLVNTLLTPTSDTSDAYTCASLSQPSVSSSPSEKLWEDVTRSIASGSPPHSEQRILDTPGIMDSMITPQMKQQWILFPKSPAQSRASNFSLQQKFLQATGTFPQLNLIDSHLQSSPVLQSSNSNLDLNDDTSISPLSVFSLAHSPQMPSMRSANSTLHENSISSASEVANVFNNMGLTLNVDVSAMRAINLESATNLMRKKPSSDNLHETM